MPAPLLPLIASTIGRLVAANVSRSVAGAVSRSTAIRGAAAAATPGNARSPLQFVAQYARQQAGRRSARARRTFTRKAPGFAQAHHWGAVKKAFGRLERARAAKQSALQIGDPLKVMRAEEQEEAAKAKLQKATKELLDSFVGLRRGLLGVVVALHTLPFAIQAIGRAQVELIRSRGGMFAGQTAGSLVRYDVNERLNRISSARNTQGTDSRLIEATMDLNNSMKPMNELLHVIYTEGLVRLVYATKTAVDVMQTFSPMVGALQSIATWLTGWQPDQKPKDITVEMMRGFVNAARQAAEQAQKDWNKNKVPPRPGVGP